MGSGSRIRPANAGEFCCVLEAKFSPVCFDSLFSYNPEEMLVAALSSCHMLWYLHLCADAGVVVTSYEDHAEGTMEDSAKDGGRFVNVTLKPRVRVTYDSSLQRANELHGRAHTLCFIANSVNFPVACEAVVDAE